MLTSNEANDFALVNQGQVKWLATKAYEQFELEYPGPANDNIAVVITNFSQNNNYSLVNLGQLKALAYPFYNRLIELRLTNTYPWESASHTSSDYALANIGQLKQLFSFEILDSDDDGIPDQWEIDHGLDPYDTTDAQDDLDGDGLTSLEEYQLGTLLDDPDTDGDGLTDYQETTIGANPLLPDVEESLERAKLNIEYYWNIIYPTPILFTNAPGSPQDLQQLNDALQALSGHFYKKENITQP